MSRLLFDFFFFIGGMDLVIVVFLVFVFSCWCLLGDLYRQILILEKCWYE